MAQIGSIEIPVEVTDKNLQRDLDKSKRKIEQFDKDTEKLTQKKQDLELDTQKTEAQLTILNDKIEEINSRLIEIRANWPGDDDSWARNIGYSKQEYDGLVQKQNELIERSLIYTTQLENIKEKEASITSKVEETNSARKSEIENLNELVRKSDELKNSESKIDFSQMNAGLTEHGNRIESIIRKVGRWALAVFGVRGMYSLVRQAASTIGQYDKKIAADIEYIRFALAMTLKPVVEWLIKAAYKILQLIGNIIYTLTGKNIFKNSGVSKFQKGMKSAEKSSKKIKDNMTAGFDEVNKLESNDTSSASGGSGSGGALPSTDLSKMEPVKIEWLDKIKEHWKEILIALGLIIGAVLLLKLAFSKLSGTNPGKIFEDIGKALEIIALLGGIALVLHELTDFIETVSETGMGVGELFGVIAVALGTLAVAFTGMAAATKLINTDDLLDLIVILGGIALIVHELSGLIDAMTKSGWEAEEMALAIGVVMLSIIALIAALTAAAIVLATNPLALAGVAVLAASIVAILITMKKTLPTILDAIGKFINTIAPSVIKIIDKIGQLIEKIILALGKTLPPIIRSIGSVFNTVFNGINSVIKTLTNSIIKVLDKIIWFVEHIGPAVETSVDALIRAVTKLINFIISAIEFAVNKTVIAGVNKIIDGINKIGDKVGFTLKRADEVKLSRFVPKLASGGIVNNPGKGVPIALAGEAGAEAVIPLNDETMERLGSAIARHMSVNLTNISQMNGRTISRELKKVMNENEFSYNG